MATEPRALPPAILIAGVDQTRKTRAVGSLRIEYQLGARGRASLEILDQKSDATAYRPTLDQRVEVKSWDGRSLFRGTVVAVEDQPLGAPGVGTVTQLDCVDDWFGAAQRRVSRVYPAGATLKSVVSDLVTTYLAVYGITLDPAMGVGPTLPALTFDQINLEEAFNRLVDFSGWLYRLRPTGVIEWFSVGTKTRSGTLSAANKNILGPITWTKSRGQYANRIILRYGTGLVAIDYAEGLQSGGGSIASALRACFTESILPVAFGLMALRFALRAFAPPAHAPLLLHDPDGTAQ